MLFEAQLEWGTPELERRTIRNCLEQAVYAEEMGFDGVWAVEHHSLVEYSHMTSPEVFLSAVACRTKRVRVGHAAVCMAFGYNHPARVAERAAMLDIISDGRLDLGAARGATDTEMALCGVPSRDVTAAQVREALRFIGRCWRDETIEWESDLLSIHPPEGRPAHTILPRPVQQPHPPLYLACTSPDTVKTAARYGVAPLILGFGGPEAVDGLRKMYDEACAGRDPEEFVSPGVTNDEFVALCPSFLMEDREQALPIGARALRFFAEAISHWAAPNAAAPAHGTEAVDNVAFMQERWKHFQEATARGEEPATPAARNYNLDHAIGDPDTAVAYVERLRDAGVTNVMCLIQMGTLTQDQQLETIRLWGDRVIPHFRERRAVGAAAS
jgi:alkanesulfonate monooxygenase SsuD/methylene tetrahydromethanopterin reductase-like flavin-dependent oxidoreductase (luciferase family)